MWNINFVVSITTRFHRLKGISSEMAIAAAEAAVAIALIINIYRQFATVSVDDVDELKY
jgi:NADH:ubiquinone oxidoreductase subunit K